VTKFDHPAAPGRQERQKPVEHGEIRLEGRRQLEEHGPELSPQGARMLEEERERSGGVPEPQEMGDNPARFDGELEVRRGRLPPADEGVRCREPVERIVELDRTEPGREVGELLLLAESFRVEHTSPPVGVDVSRGPDPGAWT
jgi:hypothetical protein